MGREPYSDRLVVEDCLNISIFKLKKFGYFKAENIKGILKWDKPRNDISNILVEVKENKETKYCNLTYNVLNEFGFIERVNYWVKLESTYCNYGGKRWWFTCPGVINDIPCQRRVGVLYLAPKATYFACRNCYNLIHRSARENHKYDSLNRDLGLLLSNSREVVI